MSGIAVVGSMNMDVVNRVKCLPLPGETISSFGTAYNTGGKGANQAAAAAMAGGSVMMLGAVGHDQAGAVLIDSIKGFGVNTDSIVIKEGSTGTAFITVDNDGENHIILSRERTEC